MIPECGDKLTHQKPENQKKFTEDLLLYPKVNLQVGFVFKTKVAFLYKLNSFRRPNHEKSKHIF